MTTEVGSRIVQLMQNSGLSFCVCQACFLFPPDVNKEAYSPVAASGQLATGLWSKQIHGREQSPKYYKQMRVGALIKLILKA